MIYDKLTPLEYLVVTLALILLAAVWKLSPARWTPVAAPRRSDRQRRR